MISQALENKFLSSFVSNRYSLYDVSFRESGTTSSIGFSFNDIQDSSYIEPLQAFKPFENFGIQPITDIIEKIQNSIFQHQPLYNPISMIGLVIDDAILTCIKAYIRFDLSEAQTSLEGGNIVKNIIKTVTPQQPSVSAFTEITQNLEDLGFVFYFVGVDSYANGSKRFKLYFKFFGENDLDIKKTILVLSQFDFCNNVKKVFEKHKNGIWGLALSTDMFEYVNGIQLYFYP